MSGFEMRLADIAPAIGAQRVGDDVRITGVSTDSRSTARLASARALLSSFGMLIEVSEIV